MGFIGILKSIESEQGRGFYSCEVHVLGLEQNHYKKTRVHLNQGTWLYFNDLNPNNFIGNRNIININTSSEGLNNDVRELLTGDNSCAIVNEFLSSNLEVFKEHIVDYFLRTYGEELPNSLEYELNEKIRGHLRAITVHPEILAQWIIARQPSNGASQRTLCRFLAAYLYECQRVDYCLTTGKRYLTNDEVDAYSYLKGYVFNGIKNDKEKLKTAIKNDREVLLEAQTEEDKHLCIQACPFSERNFLCTQYQIDSSQFYLLNEEYPEKLKECIASIRKKNIDIGYRIIAQRDNSPCNIWDTSEIEDLLHPERTTFSFKVLKDNEATEKLFWNQVRETLSSKEKYDYLKPFLPAEFVSIADANQDLLFNDVFTQRAPICITEIEDIFNTPAAQEKCFDQQDFNLYDGKYLIIAAESHWGRIADEINGISLVEGEGEYTMLNLEKLIKLKTNENPYLCALGKYAVICKENNTTLYFGRLPNIFKEKTDFSDYVAEGQNESSILCIKPEMLDKFLSKGQPFDKAFIFTPLSIPSVTKVNNQKEFDQWTVDLEEYREYKKTFKISDDKAKEFAGKRYSPFANYWIYQPWPKLFELMLCYDSDKISKHITQNYPNVILTKKSIRSKNCISNRISVKKEYRIYEEEEEEIKRIGYWKQQLALFDNITTDDEQKILVMSCEKEVAGIKALRNKDFQCSNKNEKTCTFLNRLSKQSDSAGLLALRQLLSGEVAPISHKFAIVINSVAFANSYNQEDICCAIYHKLAQYGKIYYIDPTFANRSIQIKKAIEYNDKYIRQAFYPREKILDVKELNTVIKWIEDIWNVPEHDSIGKEPKGKLYSIQKEAIKKALEYNGDNNSFLTIMPTGKGKSIVFQGPILYKAIKKESKKLSIVITPLQALMRNQVEELVSKSDDFKNKVAYLDSNSGLNEQRRVKRLIKEKKLSLLYLSPERFLISHFYNSVIEKSMRAQGIDSFIFDEAHCIIGWGMEFRPDYVHALRKCIDLQKKHPEICIQLYTATLPKQAKKELLDEFKDERGIVEFDENNIVPAINTESYVESLCPIRDHIDLLVKKVEGVESSTQNEEIFEKKLNAVNTVLFGDGLQVCEKINKSEKSRLVAFDQELLLSKKSRVIVFTRTRAEAEEGAKWLQDKNISFRDAIGYFHAGLSKSSKEDTLRKYQSGEYVILFATKAFGLGMNIKNIHLVIHLTPPSYIEDYLQEVGRAARDKREYENTFPEQNGSRSKINAICLYAPKDTSRYRDRINKIEWDDIIDSFSEIKKYAGNKRDKWHVIPINLLERKRRDEEVEGTEEKDLTEAFQQSLIWLSRKDGLNRIEIGYRCPDSYDLGIGKSLSSFNELLDESSNLWHLAKYADQHKENERVVIRFNDLLAEVDLKINSVNELEELIEDGIERDLFTRAHMYINVGINEGSKQKIKEFVEDEKPLKVLDTVLYLLNEQNSKGFNYEQALNEHLDIEHISVKEISYIKRVLNENTWVFFKDLNYLYTTVEIKEKCEKLLKTIYFATSNSVSWTELEKAIDAHTDPHMLKLFLYALYRLNYAKRGNICTDYMEIRINNSDEITNDPNDPCKKKFNEYYEIKQLKAGAMCGLIEEYRSSKKMKELIREYSKLTSDSLYTQFELIRDYKNRQTARQHLEEKVKSELNDEQQRIYNVGVDKNINVIAGAGSGKTRLLTYRALRLILAENNPERKILILAYNRAVRDELSERIQDYAEGIGYTLRGLQIYTFHGFAKKCLPEPSKNIEEWEKELLRHITDHEGQYSGKFQYILVDEFQDVTNTRLEIIQKLLELNNAHAFVIGDMFQSIYGYEKIRDGGSVEPLDYYDRLNGFEKYSLTKNYRSTQAIINTAIKWFEGITDAIKKQYDSYINEYLKTLKSVITDDKCNDDIPPMKGDDWKNDFLNIIFPELCKNKLSTIAILFRTNSDVHSSFAFLEKQEIIKSFDLRIQGSDVFFMDTREFFFFNKFLLSKSLEEINIDDINNWTLQNCDEDILSVAKQLAIILINKHNLKTYDALQNEFNTISYLERDRLKEYVEKELPDCNNKCKIVLSTIHKVKGMEYDAVVVPASSYCIDEDEGGNMEERRLMYVAFSRAKRHLYYYMGPRENAILLNQSYEGETGCFYAQDGPGAVDYGFAAQKGCIVNNKSYFSINEYITKCVSPGDEIMLKRVVYYNNPTPNDRWYIYHGSDFNNIIGALSNNNKLKKRLNTTKYKRVCGLSVKSVCVCDKQLEGREWSEEATKQGYVYYVDYYGCACPLNDENNG